jgi:RHH-type transcriptional regulator, rel operon repressor / antitoxin RelB
MSKQAAVRLSDETFERLQTLAARTGRTATYYIREAVEEKIQDLEDLYLAEEVVRRRMAEGGDDISLEELSKRLGLED